MAINLPNIFMTPEFGADVGLLSDDLQKQLQQQATKAGLLTTAVDFLTAPRTRQAGSFLPYLGTAYGKGMGAAAGTYGAGLQQELAKQLRQQKMYTVDGALVDAQGNVVYQSPEKTTEELPYAKINIADFEPESVVAFEKSGRLDWSLLKPRKATEGTASADVQLLNLYENKRNQLAENPNDLTLKNQVKAIEKELGLLEEPISRGEEIKKELTPIDIAIDKEAAKELAAFNIGGGFSDAQKSLKQLDAAINTLETTPEGTITGTLIGYTPDYFKPLFEEQAVVVKDQVEEIVQRNLRLILGAQFTEKEGTRLIERAYNPKLSQVENARRLKLLQQQIFDAARNKQQAYNFYQQNGTIKGFAGTLYTKTGQFLEEYNSRIGVEEEPQEQPKQQEEKIPAGVKVRKKNNG